MSPMALGPLHPGPTHPIAEAELAPFFTFHHLGVATLNPTTTMGYLGCIGYREGHRVLDPLQNVNLCMWHHATQPDVEVIWPSDTVGPLNRMLKKSGAGVYHVCYETVDLPRSLEHLRSNGISVLEVVGEKPAILFENRHVSFYSVDGFGLIEFLVAS